MPLQHIVCHAKHETWQEFMVTADSRVWPCSNFTSADIQPHNFNKKHPLLEDDPYLKELMETDPDWNNLDKRSMNEITSHPFFVKHLSTENWNSDNPPDMCLRCCNQGKQK